MASKPRRISPRLRFEIFKRDSFRCQYCGRRSPEVVLELDHIIAAATGGTDDEINLTTSCWECNNGKSDAPLREIMTGEDPHDRALLLLERERQLREYEAVRHAVELRFDQNMEWIERQFDLNGDFKKTVRRALRDFSAYDLADAIGLAIAKTGGRNPETARYFCGILRNWRKDGIK